MTQLALLLEGALIAVDPEGSTVWKTAEKHRKAVRSFIEEVGTGYLNNEAIFLKFPQVRQGLSHLEELASGLDA